MREFVHRHIRLDLNRSLTMVVDVCQYIHKVSAASQENPQQMVLASKLLSQEQSCEEYLARAKDQLLSIGTGTEVGNSFERFNVLRSAKFNHALREKGQEEKVTAAASTSPNVVKERPQILNTLMTSTTGVGVLFGMVILILVLKCYFMCQHS